MNRPSKIIGLSVGPRSLFLAEISAAGSAKPSIQQLAEFPYPEGLSLTTPAELGTALAAFLKTQKFSTKDVIIGLPARRLLTRRKEVPPAKKEVAAATLRLQAETEFSSAETDPYAIDFAGTTSSAEPSAVLLIATAQSCVDQCVGLAKAAGLKLRGITASGAALGRATSTLPGGDGLIVSLASGGAELVMQHGRNSTQLRHLAIANAGTPESMGALVGEIRRTIATLHQNGTPLTLALWDDAAGDSGAAGGLLGERLGMAVTSPNVRSLAQANHQATNLNAYAPAVAVALSAMDAAGPPVDFLHSRLIAPAAATNRRPILIGSILAGVFVLAVIAGYVDLQLKQGQFDELTHTHNARASDLKVAQAAADRVRVAHKWTHKKPDYIACLRDLTNLFQDDVSIWVTKFTLSSNNKGVISGKAVNEAETRRLVEKMLASKQFTNPTRDWRAMPNRNGPPEYSFEIKFDYKPSEKP